MNLLIEHFTEKEKKEEEREAKSKEETNVDSLKDLDSIESNREIGGYIFTGQSLHPSLQEYPNVTPNSVFTAPYNGSWGEWGEDVNVDVTFSRMM